MVDFGRRAVSLTHAARHEDGGADEISLASLSGELADDQPAKAHDLAGSVHNADTLADLNTKVSNATLDDSGDSRTPSAHKTSHQDAGTDEIDASGLVGRTNYVDRGDPSSWDWEVGDLTTDATWRDLDCSAIVPAGAIALDLLVWLKDDAAGSNIMFKKKDNTNDISLADVRTQVANVDIAQRFIIACDTNRIVEYYGKDLAFVTIRIHVCGWFI